MLNSEKTILALNDIRDEYLESARLLLKYSEKEKPGRMGKKRIITFALAAALLLGMGTAAYALGAHSGFFHNAFGTGVPGREAGTVRITDEEGTVIAEESYPAEERVDMQEEQAEALIGAYVSAVGQRVQLGDYTFTICDVAIDESGMGAVTVEIDNPNGHGLAPTGAFLGDQVPDPWFGYSLQGSKGTPISSHDYAVAEGYSETHIAMVYSITPARTLEPDEDILLRFGLYSRDNDEEKAELVIPAAERIPTEAYATEGLTVFLSPVGMTLCFSHAYNDQAYEEYLLKKVVISFADGSRYVVADADTINYMSAVNDSEDRGLKQITFNRLIDPKAIERIDIIVVHSSSHETAEEIYCIT